MIFMNRFKNLSTFKKIIVVSVIVLFLAFSVIKTYFPQVGLSSWKNDINYIASEKANEAEDKDLTVYFLDVGQNDCTLIKTGHGNILIDCAGSIEGGTVVKFLLSHNVESLEYLVITHPHSDHYGGASELLDFIEVKNVLMPQIPEELYSKDKSFVYLIGKLNKSEIPFVAARAGDTFEFGSVLMSVVCADTSGTDLNNMSAVLRLDYGDTSFLFMGDTDESIENKLIGLQADIKCDVLKVGHHGSSESSCDAFLKAAAPYVAVISCGYGNDYGHPGEDVLYRLKNNGISYLRTDINGNIVFGSDGERIYCYFEKGNRF